MIRFRIPKSALLAITCGGGLFALVAGAPAQEITPPAPSGSITIPQGSQPSPTGGLGTALEGNGSLSTGQTGSFTLPGQDVLKSTATPVDEKPLTPVTPGAPATDPTPTMTGGMGISINGEEAATQRGSGSESFDRGSRLSPDIGKELPNPKYSRGIGEMPRGQQEALPAREQRREEAIGRTEFTWLDQAKLAKEPMEAPDRVKIRWKNRDYVIRLYFVISGDAAQPNSRRTMQMASRTMVKPEQAAEAFSKAAEMTKGWLEATPNLRIATRWEKVNPLMEETDYYGFVFMGDESLGHRLVKEGWANSQGKKVTGPHEERASEILGALLKVEEEARKQRMGLWGWTGKTQGTQFVPERR